MGGYRGEVSEEGLGKGNGTMFWIAVCRGNWRMDGWMYVVFPCGESISDRAGHARVLRLPRTRFGRWRGGNGLRIMVVWQILELLCTNNTDRQARSANRHARFPWMSVF